MATPTLANSSPDLSTTLTTRTDAERRIQNAAMLLELWKLGEQLDPLKVALNGFPDVNSSRAYYAGND